MHEASILRLKYNANRKRVNILNYSLFIARGTSVGEIMKVMGKTAKVLVKVQPEGKYSEFN